MSSEPQDPRIATKPGLLATGEGVRYEKEYRRKANDICDRAKSENRPMNFHEQRQAEAYRRAAFQLMIDSLLSNTFSKLQRDANAGKLSMGQLEMVKLLARKGYPGAREILQNVLG